MTPYYSDDTATLYLGDTCEVMSAMQPATFDLTFTSPPYNLGTTTGIGMHAGSLAAKKLAGGYGTHTDDMAPEDYHRWLLEVAAHVERLTNDTGAYAMNHKPRVQSRVCKLPTEYAPPTMPLRQVVIWDRGTGLNFSPSFFLPKCEWIVIWARDGWSLRDRATSAIGDVWRIPPENASDHPAPFPVALPARLLGALPDGGTVLDPFAGSGSTLIAAKRAGWRSVGVEIHEPFAELAARRLEREAATPTLDLWSA